jgi:hypothetical protein
MKDDAISKYLDLIKSTPAYDSEFIGYLIYSYAQNQEGEETARKILASISRRYAENQKNQT